jgi:dTDP-4-dehydrorhamnose 3,5-epimerase-like enzyme
MGFESVQWIDFIDNVDERGRLTAIEGEITLPFAIKRVFYVHEVQQGVARGGHAHRDTDQVLTALGGSLDVLISNGVEHREYILDHPGKGLYVPRMLWVSMFNFSQDAVCLVFANTNYDQSKSIRTWAEFLEGLGISFKEEPGL